MPRQGSRPKLNRTQTNLYREQLEDIIREVTHIQKDKKKTKDAKQISAEAEAIDLFKLELERFKLQSSHGSSLKEPTVISEKEEEVAEGSDEEGSPPNSSDEYDTDLEIEGNYVFQILTKGLLKSRRFQSEFKYICILL